MWDAPETILSIFSWKTIPFECTPAGLGTQEEPLTENALTTIFPHSFALCLLAYGYTLSDFPGDRKGFREKENKDFSLYFPCIFPSHFSVVGIVYVPSLAAVNSK